MIPAGGSKGASRSIGLSWLLGIWGIALIIAPDVIL
jgi:hypothetical protein